MSRRRGQTPRQQQQPQSQTSGKQSGRADSSRGFLDKFRVSEQSAASVAPGMKSTAQPRRGSRPRRKKNGMSPWQIFSMIVMVILGLALVGSTFLPYVAGITSR